jgi:diphthine-ammonia ligase
MEEFYISQGKLIPKDEWEKKITCLKESIKSDIDDKSEAMRLLTEHLVRAVNERVPSEEFGVLFSGGVDSSLIALILKKTGKEFTCYTLGFKNEDTKDPEDVDAAEKTAKMLGLKLKKIILDAEGAGRLIRRTVKILGPKLNNVVNVGVASVELGCIEMAKKDGVRYLFGGLGSEELFAGYDRHRQAADPQAECWNGLLGMYGRDLLRDSAVSTATGIDFLTPFLDIRLIETAMRVPAKLKIDDSLSKLILREVAEELGLPKEVAWRPKRAAQYGSRMDKAIDKLSRAGKFKLKKDYLKSLE